MSYARIMFDVWHESLRTAFYSYVRFVFYKRLVMLIFIIARYKLGVSRETAFIILTVR